MNNPDMFNKFRGVFLKVDPIGIYYSDADNIDEYDSEIETLIQSISLEDNFDTFRKLTQNIFEKSFGGDACLEYPKIQVLIEALWDSLKKHE